VEIEDLGRFGRCAFGVGIAIMTVGLSKGWLDWSIPGALLIYVGAIFGWNNFRGYN